MRRRELRRVSTDEVIGAVQINGTEVTYEQHAGDVFGALRRQLGDRRAAEILLDDGWSNGYLFLAPELPS
jgi:hypothetical protein